MSDSPKRASLRLRAKVVEGQNGAEAEPIPAVSDEQPVEAQSEAHTKPSPAAPVKPWCSEDVVLVTLAAVTWTVGTGVMWLLLLNIVFDLSGPVNLVRFVVDTAMESFGNMERTFHGIECETFFVWSGKSLLDCKALHLLPAVRSDLKFVQVLLARSEETSGFTCTTSLLIETVATGVVFAFLLYWWWICHMAVWRVIHLRQRSPAAFRESLYLAVDKKFESIGLSWDEFVRMDRAELKEKMRDKLQTALHRLEWLED